MEGQEEDEINNSTPQILTIPLKELRKWAAFSLLINPDDLEILSKAKIAYCFGRNGIIVTNNDNVYGIGYENGTIKPNTKEFSKIGQLCGKNVIDFKAARTNLIFAITQDGKVYSWGKGKSQLGRITGSERCNQPNMIGGFGFGSLETKKVVELSCSGNHSLALTDRGLVYIWGENQGSPRFSHVGSAVNPPCFIQYPYPYMTDCFKNEKIVGVAASKPCSVMLSETGKLFCVMNCVCRLPHEVKTNIIATKIVGSAARCLVLTKTARVYVICINKVTKSLECPASEMDILDKGCNIEVKEKGTFESVFPSLKLCETSDVEKHALILDICGDSKSDVLFCKSYNKVFKVKQVKCRDGSRKFKLIETKFTTFSDAFSNYTHGEVMPRVLKADQIWTGLGKNIRKLYDDTANLWNDKELSDVSFQVEDKIIPAHKIILQMRCSNFRTMFKEGCWKEAKQNLIPIDGFKYVPFRSLLYFLYHDKLDVAEVEYEVLIDILQLADFYNLPNLLEETALILSRGLNVDNALSIYRGADLYNALDLKSHVFNFIMDHKFKLANKVSRILELDRQDAEKSQEILLDIIKKLSP